MADVKTDYSYEAAHEANAEIGKTEEGRKLLSNPGIGKTVLDKFEETEKLAKEGEKLKAENVRDSLTGVYSRRYFDEQLESRLESGKKISLAMLDMDFFKKLNDTYGHVTGDRLLIENARTLSNHLRLARPNGSRDFIARYGGDEFAVVLADVDDINEVKKIMDNLRFQISNTEFKIDKNTSVPNTVSVGITVCRENDIPAGLIERADRGLYLAKQRGRNRVEISPD